MYSRAWVPLIIITIYLNVTIAHNETSLASNSNLTPAISPLQEFNSVFSPLSGSIVNTTSLNESSSEENLHLKLPQSNINQLSQQLLANSSSQNESQSDECRFMSFEEWKKQKIIDTKNNSTTISTTTTFTRSSNTNSYDKRESELNESKFNENIDPSLLPKTALLTNITQIEGEGKTYKDKFNFASVDCAATIVKTNSQAKGASAILKENKDSYLLNECSVADKFVIIELCQDILVGSVVLGNYEFFSSMFKDIRVSVSDRYPAHSWRELGTFTAKNIRDVQLFQIENPLIWARYLKIDILSHYGNEFYCPISIVRVHGKTMIDEFKEDEEKLKQSQESKSIEEQYSQNLESELDETLLLNDHINECRVRLPHLALDEFLKDLNSSQLCFPSDNNTNQSQASYTSLSSTTPSTITTQESIYKNIIKRLTLLEANATLSLLYIEEQSKLLSDAFTKLEKRQSINYNNLLASVNSTLVNQLFNFKDSYNQLNEQYNNLLKSQEKNHKLYLTESAKKLRSLDNEVVNQKRLTIFNTIIILFLLVYVILTRDINLDLQEINNKISNKTSKINKTSMKSDQKSHSKHDVPPISNILTEEVIVPYNPKLHPKHKRSI
ncbi:uncharacterized protein KGF55_003131 [Candida pseudojiufengensis]|uniref:uncharacterized protein n=1 Tax=Candida pseudojiufengensis TaxID=497109 RepID=UPI00222587AB|nr:uncharacterized protein KGF55_003131 [Candida pseudojiufengensis]KAI5963339.1 hypothetical protein KGF55_003131 [Candida pseudojiufengensis]